ncbi:MAG: hypothetical protein ACLPYS_20515 [Vulcanimicrobiaceae bacterium]|jgi:hypothetical protein
MQAIWFDAFVSIALIGRGGRRVEIVGRPVKNHVSGPLFLEYHRRLREASDLAGVWVVVPEQVVDQDPSARRAVESARHPTFIHLDRLARS